MKMNTPSPLVPQGSLPDKGRSHFRITVLATVAVHVVLLCVLLIAGCNKKDTTDQAANLDNSGGTPAPTSTEPPPWPTTPPTPPPSPTQDNAVVAPPPLAPSNHTVVAPPVPFTPEPVVPAPAVGTEHTIVKGELLSTIAKKYGVGWKAIEAANPGINPNRLKIGDKIKIPAPKSGAAPAAAPNAPAVAGDGAVKTYKVKSGDNLMKIAKSHGVGVKALRAANGLKTDQIKVGQTLKIPAKAPSPSAAPDLVPAAPTVPPVPPPGLPPGNP